MAPAVAARRRHSTTSTDHDDSLGIPLEPPTPPAPPQPPTPPALATQPAPPAPPATPNQPDGSTINRKRKRSRLFFNPSDAFCHWWSGVVSLAFLYNFWSLSYRFAFREIDSSTVTIWFLLDYTADLIYLNDIWVNFRTGHLEDGVLQRDPQKIGLHYRESTLFYLDTLCLLPFDFLYLSFGYCSIMRCNKLVKIYKFWSFVDRTERHTNYPNVFRTFALVHYILVIFHWNACLFHMISKHKIIDIESLYKINDNQCDDISCQYLHAFYWSTLALTLIGDLPRPRTRGEYIYVIVELVFGLFLFASVLGHVANIVTNVSAARKEFQAKLDSVKTFMRTRRVSDELQNKVIRWFDYLWLSQKSSDEEKSVACLPDRLKAEIAIHVNLDTLKRVDIFQNTEAGFLCELVLRLKPVLFSPGDYVCRKNEVGHEMYIVSRGILEVVTDDGRQIVVATFRAGCYFGEIAVLNVGLAGNKRTASVRSVGYSDLFCLSKRDLWDVLKDYPNAEARIRAVAEERLSMLGGGGGGGGSAGKSSRPPQSNNHRKSPTHSTSWTSTRSNSARPARPEAASRPMRGRVCSFNATPAHQPECPCRASGCALHPTISMSSANPCHQHQHLSEYPHPHYFDAGPPTRRPRTTRHHYHQNHNHNHNYNYNHNQHNHHHQNSTSAYTLGACPHQQQQLTITQMSTPRPPHLSDSKSIDHQLAHRHGCPAASVTQLPPARGRHRDTEPESSSSMAPTGSQHQQLQSARLGRRSSSLVAVPGALPVKGSLGGRGGGGGDYATTPTPSARLELKRNAAGPTGSSRASLSSSTLLCKQQQQQPGELFKTLARTTTTSDSLSSLNQSTSQRAVEQAEPEVGAPSLNAGAVEEEKSEECGGGGDAGESVRIEID